MLFHKQAALGYYLERFENYMIKKYENIYAYATISLSPMKKEKTT
jgi:hypothetical protein